MKLHDIARTVRQALCTHRVATDRITRIAPNLVTANCNRCGKPLSAPYGIALPAKLEAPRK